MHGSTSSLLPCLLLTASLAACQSGGGGGGGHGPVAREDAPTASAELICEQQQSCGCELPFASTMECVDATSQTFADALAEAEAAGLTYQPECMGQYLDGYESLGCQTISELLDSGDFFEGSEAMSCKVVVGTASEGEACTSHWEVFGDSCVEGLFCSNGTCISLSTPTAKMLGEVCEPQTDICETGAICTNSAADPQTFTCTALPGVGESCMDLPQCQEGSFCDTADFVCKGPVGEGEACQSSVMCQSGLYCDSAGGTCVQTLAEGDACDGDEQCGEGLECEGACVPETPLICP